MNNNPEGSRRSKRLSSKRKIHDTANFEDEDVDASKDESTESVSSKSSRTKKSKEVEPKKIVSNTKESAKKKGAAKSKKQKVYDLEKLFTRMDSKLIYMELRRIFNNDIYDKFTNEQKEQLLALLPDYEKIDSQEEKADSSDINLSRKATEQIMDIDLKNVSDETHIDMAVDDEEEKSIPTKHNMDIDYSKISDESQFSNENMSIDENGDKSSLTEKDWVIADTSVDENGDHALQIASNPGQINNAKIAKAPKKTKKILRPYFFYHVVFKECIDAFQDKLYYGHYNPLAMAEIEAEQAFLRETLDEEWKDEKFEAQWGHNLGSDKWIAGESKSISLPRLFQAGVIQKNDELRYHRTFQKLDIVVEATLKVINVESDGSFNSEIVEDNKNKNKNKKKNSGRFKNITILSRFENELLDYDGKVGRGKENRPNGNAFKNFTIWRGDRNLGSIFELRKDYYEKTLK